MPPTQNPQLPNGYPEQPQPQQPAGQPTSAYQQVQPTQQPVQQMPQLHVSQPAPQAPQPSESPYDFFMEPKQAAKKRTGIPGGSGGMSGFTKILIGGIGLLVAMGLLAAVLTASRGSKDTSSTGLTAVAESQQEIIRVSTAGQTHLESQKLLNFATTAIATNTSSQGELIDYINKHGGKISLKELALAKNTKTDQVLDAAASASTYDPTFQTVMERLIADYEAKIQSSAKTAVTESARTILDKNLKNALLLQQMVSP